MNFQVLRVAYSTARKVVISVIGFSVVCLGLALLVLPGPAVVVIPAGLAILALEFAWARRWLRLIKEHSARVFQGGSSRRDDKEQE